MKELEEKFRKAMIRNAQLDNEKSAMAYQVELYKDKYQDLEAAYSVLQVDEKNIFLYLFPVVVNDEVYLIFYRKSIKKSVENTNN